MFVSTETFTGKTGICLSVAQKLAATGQAVGYMKPVGNLPTTVDGALTDEDAVFAAEVLGRRAQLADVSPLILTAPLTDKFLLGERVDYRKNVLSAFRRLSQGMNVMILEGTSHVNDGKIFGLSSPQVAELLGAAVILISKFADPYEMVDDILVARERFGAHFAGVIFNWVRPQHLSVLESLMLPFFTAEKINVLGAIPKDKTLLAVRVRELAEFLRGEVLCAENHLDELVETFMVGAMGQEQALRFFARKANKAVLTGGDRADIQLAALETQTKCLILTGNYYPSASVLAVAEAKGVPMIKVDMDTLTAAQATESLVGRERVHDTARLAEVGRLVDKHIDFDLLSGILETALTV